MKKNNVFIIVFMLLFVGINSAIAQEDASTTQYYYNPQAGSSVNLPLPTNKDLKRRGKNIKYSAKDLPMPKDCDYSKVTKDPKIIAALNMMYGTVGEWSREAILGNNISGKPIKVEFRDLSAISSAYASFDALGWRVSKKKLKIFINARHRNAPPEALACLLSHEAIHQDEQSSITEETFGWLFEASEWIQQKDRNPELKNPDMNIYPLVQRENKLQKLYEDGGYTDRFIRKAVSSNAGYSNLPETSPGFGE